MLNTIYCEFLKLKKSKFYLLIFLTTCFLPSMLLLGRSMNGQFVEWNDYMIQVEQTNFMLKSLAMFALISSYIYTREISCNTENVLFSYPVNRIKIFISKFIVAISIMFVSMIFEVLLTILGGLILPHAELTSEIFIGHIKVNFYVLLIQIAISPIAIFVGLVSKNVIMPMIYSGAVTIVNIFVVGSKSENIIQYVPFSYSMVILSNFFKTIGKGMDKKMVISNSQVILSNTSIVITILTFLMGMTICILYYSKADIN